MIVAIGGIAVKPGLRGAQFQWFAVRAFAQARRAPGAVHSDVRRRGHLIFSLSVWESADAMRGYAASGPHRAAMARVEALSTWYRFHRYRAEAVPSWADAFAEWDRAAAGAAAE